MRGHAVCHGASMLERALWALLFVIILIVAKVIFVWMKLEAFKLLL
jgi:hypothetical protein